jgi:hypothetical protein
VEYKEFSDLARTTIRGMYDRIPVQYHEGFESLFIGGEMDLAVETLVGGLARFSTPITPAERETLARLLREMNQPESRLDSLNVIALGDQNESTP